MNAQNQWVFVEMLGPEPLVIAVGNRDRHGIPLRAMLRRNPNTRQILAVLADLRSSRSRESDVFELRGGKSMHVRIVGMSEGPPHGAQFWIGEHGQPPPECPLTSAIVWDFSTYEVTNSDDWYPLLGIPATMWKPRRSFAESLMLVATGSQDAETFAHAIDSPVGTALSAVWTINTPTGEQRHMLFAARRVDEHDDDGSCRPLVRGMDIRVEHPPLVAQQKTILAEQVANAGREPGEHRALVSPRNLRLFHWLDDPLPSIAWRYDPDVTPGLHPEDLPKAQALRDRLADGPSSEVLRVRAEDGGWVAVHVAAKLVHVAATSSAALVALRLQPEDS